jgi:uncharacterized protein (DUF1697 family)
MLTLTGFFRGINVGGHHKVPMAELREKLSEIGCESVRTLLNSGNVVFETEQKSIRGLELKIEEHLSRSFGFAIPLILRTKNEIADIVDKNPFVTITVHKDIRLYISFLKEEPEIELSLPYFSKDKTFQIISINNRIICSVLDLSTTKTPKGMDELEKLFGRNITTRNWNTILKIIEI